MLHGMWNLPRSWVEPVARALAGGSLTAESPGKPRSDILEVKASL